MALSPGVNITIASNPSLEPSKTYKLDLSTGRILGALDGISAVDQYIIKTLCTERFSHLIYSAQYGIERKQLQEGNYTQDLLISEYTRIITEALNDPRVMTVGDFQFEFRVDEVYITFQVDSVFGVILGEVVI